MQLCVGCFDQQSSRYKMALMGKDWAGGLPSTMVTASQELGSCPQLREVQVRCYTWCWGGCSNWWLLAAPLMQQAPTSKALGAAP